jgi:hypothetical protein
VCVYNVSTAARDYPSAAGLLVYRQLALRSTNRMEENDLEAQRLANIAANAQRMQEFGLHDAAQSIRPTFKAAQAPRPR